MTIRRSVFDAYPCVAMNMLRAFEASKDASVERIREITTSRIPLPWGAAIAAEVAAKFGGDLWPYGVSPSAATLNAFCRFAHAQHLTPSLLTIQNLFPDEVIGMTRV